LSAREERERRVLAVRDRDAVADLFEVAAPAARRGARPWRGTVTPLYFNERQRSDDE
jgi:hypothetical protein